MIINRFTASDAVVATKQWSQVCERRQGGRKASSRARPWASAEQILAHSGTDRWDAMGGREAALKGKRAQESCSAFIFIYLFIFTYTCTDTLRF